MNDKQSIYVPRVLDIIIERNFQHPSQLYACFKQAFEEELLFTFLLRKNQFLAFTSRYFGFKIPEKGEYKKSIKKGVNNSSIMIEDGDLTAGPMLDEERDNPASSSEGQEIELAKQLFRIFKVENEAQRFKVVNMLEVFTALILLTDFSVQECVKTKDLEGKTNSSSQTTPLTAAKRLESRADMIEHKVNLLLLLFSFREVKTLNISEIIIMVKTCVLSLKKVFPGTRVFKSSQVQSEIKALMMILFQKRIEENLKEEKLRQQLLLQRQLEKQSPKSKI